MLSSNLPPCCHISLSYIMKFDIKKTHQRIQTTCLHTSRCHHCHYCNIDFVSFHNITSYTSSLSSCILVNIAYLLNITCTLIFIAWRRRQDVHVILTHHMQREETTTYKRTSHLINLIYFLVDL